MNQAGDNPSTYRRRHSTDNCDIGWTMAKRLAWLGAIATYGGKEDAEMADRLPPVPEGGFKDEDDFAAWLKNLPEEHVKPFAQVLAHRASLRVLPNLNSASSADIDTTAMRSSVVLLMIRAAISSWVALKFPEHQTRRAAHSASNSAASITLATAASIALSVVATASRSAASAQIALAQKTVALAAQSAARSNHTSALYDEKDAKSFWHAQSRDAGVLASGTPPLDIMATPLWFDNDIPDWWTESKQRFQDRLELLDQRTMQETGEPGRFSIWLEWYNAIAQGRPPWSLPKEDAWQLERRIGLGDGRGDDFWQRERGEINREIAGWVEEARRKVREEDQETTFDLNSIAPPEQIENATQLAVNDDGKIDLARPAPENRLLDTQSQRQEYFAAKSDALVLQSAGSNRLGKLLPELEALLRAMPEDFAAATVFDLWRAINRLRRTSNAHRALGPDADGHEAKLEPSVAEDLDHLLDGLNILAFNDPKLRERDITRIPPQDRASNETARELMEPLVENVIQNENLTTEAAAETVEADIASATDADNTEHGAQAVDQAVKTERNTLAAFFSSLTQKLKSVMAGEAGFAWKEVRAGVYRGAGTAISALALSELTGFSSVVKTTIAYAVENAAALKQVALQIFQNPRLAEMIDWIVKVFS